MIEFFRDTKFLMMQAIQKFILLLLLGLAYLQIGYTKESIQSRTGVIFFLIINSLFGTCCPILGVFPLEKRIIDRERKTGFYDGVSAYMAKYLSTIVFDLFFTFIYVSSVYWMAGLNPNLISFLIFMIIIESTILFAVALGLTVGTISPSENFSQIFGTTTLIFFQIFGGSLSNPETIPSCLRWIIWISPVNYAFRAAMNNQYRNLNFEKITGEEILMDYGIDYPSVMINLLGIWGLTILCIIIGAISLHLMTGISLNLKK